MLTRTLTIVKPDAMRKRAAGKIIDIIYKAGYNIAALKMLKMSSEQAKAFYYVHRERGFYADLVEFMSSGPVVVAILEKENAVDDYRKLIGKTNPAEADKNTIRNLFGDSVQFNAVHGSDSNENAEIECNFFFPTLERFQ